MRERKKKRIIIFSLLGLLCIMTAGYAAFQTNLKIKGTSNINSNWEVVITSVTESNKAGGAETVGTPTWTDLTAYMEANLYEKGDYVEYDVTVENKGTLDAKLENITDNIKSSNEAVKISFSGYTKGQKLEKGKNQIIKVKIEYNPEFTGTIEEGSGEVSIDLNYTQNDNYSQGEGGEIISPDRYLVTYDCITNGGSACTIYNEYLKEGESVNLEHTSEKENYTFIGWNTNKDADDALTELSMPSEDMTLYAIFKDTIPPECEITVTDVTAENVTIKANCTDISGIKEYKYIQNENIETSEKNTYKLNNYNLSKLSVEVTDNSDNKETFKINEDNLQKAYNDILKTLKSRYTEISKKQEDTEIELLDKTYPVGSIYITTTYSNASAVANAIGGTWETYGTGKTLIGVNGTDSNFNTVNKEGGSLTTTLAVTNLPSHNHSIPALSGTAASAGEHTHNNTAKSSTITGEFGYLVPCDFHLKWVSGAFSGVVMADNTTDAVSSPNTKGEIYGYKLTATPTITMTNASAGAHTHTATITKNASGSVGSGTAFTNLQPYITVYMWKRIS